MRAPFLGAGAADPSTPAPPLITTGDKFSGMDPRVSPSYHADEHAWPSFDAVVRALAAQPGVRRVCDVGGGANPALPLDFIQENGLEYVVLDISPAELDKAPSEYLKLEADITADDIKRAIGAHRGTGFDLVFSKMLAEHVPNGSMFHRNVNWLLSDGGRAVHFFPTLYAPVFLANLLLPQKISEWMMLKIDKQRNPEGLHGKFKAYYRWCRGPSARQFRRFESVGFEVEDFRAFFGLRGYLRPIGLGGIDAVATRFLLAHPVPALTSYGIVTLRKV